MFHVLLVDPSPQSHVLSERLKMQGYGVTVAHTAAEGALLALGEPPAVVVADLWMPGISGIQLCRLLRSEPATEHVPVILRGPDGNLRDRFWAERAGAVAYVSSGRMGALVRAIGQAIAHTPPQEGAFFTQLSGGELDLRDRIAANLDAALFDSVIASEIRALGVCGTFVRLFDLLSQFVSQVASYRWMAIYTPRPARIAVHSHPSTRVAAEREARAALEVADDVPLVLVEDEDPQPSPVEAAPLREDITLGADTLGRIALSGATSREDAELLRVIARELGGPLRIATLMEESERLATIDPLTGLMNRRAFASAAARELGRLDRHGTPMTVVLIDVDHFKEINDRRGHPAGDRVLAALGHLLPSRTRAGDLVGRWGGEEFVAVLSGCTAAAAAARAEDLRSAIAGMYVGDEHNERIPITASIGVAFARPMEPLDSLIDRADRAMYTAKAAGRNRVVHDEDLTTPHPTLQVANVQQVA